MTNEIDSHVVLLYNTVCQSCDYVRTAPTRERVIKFYDIHKKNNPDHNLDIEWNYKGKSRWLEQSEIDGFLHYMYNH